ncbi:hypothetical protein IWX81_000770 [Salinibacterium sp. CAN_S4]|uniref:hypothetical protein n=1 Tax=Salinibacterium sp. CAN_S4 TaxID=2787727 RepID=UPI0018EF5D58
MKRIHYSGGSVLTGDNIAHSFALYAASLAIAGSADAVIIPVVKDGAFGTAEIVIGPASQLMVEDAGIEFDAEFDEAPYLAQLDERRGRLDSPVGVQPSAAGEVASSMIDDF